MVRVAEKGALDTTIVFSIVVLKVEGWVSTTTTSSVEGKAGADERRRSGERKWKGDCLASGGGGDLAKQFYWNAQ